MNELFNRAAIIFHNLFLCGDTNVLKFIDRCDDKEIYKAAENCDIYNSDFDENKYISEIRSGDYLNSLAYLVKLDNESENNKTIVGYIKSLRGTNQSLCDGNDVMIFPTYYGLDHYYHGYDTFSALFKFLCFVDLSIFKGNEIRVNNFYLDSISYAREVEISFVQYPMNAEFKKYAESGSFPERTTPNNLDIVFLERVKKAYERFSDTKCIPSIIFAPEMVGSRYLDLELEKIIQADKNMASIICPSYHKACNENVATKKIYNESTIYVNEDRMSWPTTVRKFVPAKIEKKLEMIDTNYVSVTIIHVRNFGRIMIVICRDFLEGLFRDILESVLPSLVIVQCYSPNLKNYETNIREVCRHNACVVVGNSCSALKERYYKGGALVIGSRNCYSENEEINIRKHCFVDKNCIDKCISNHKCLSLIKLKIESCGDSKGHRPENYLKVEIE